MCSNYPKSVVKQNISNFTLSVGLYLLSDYEAVVKLSDGFNGADLRNICTEAGLFAIRAEREFVVQEDFMKAVRKVADNKNLESKLDYKPV